MHTNFYVPAACSGVIISPDTKTSLKHSAIKYVYLLMLNKLFTSS